LGHHTSAATTLDMEEVDTEDGSMTSQNEGTIKDKNHNLQNGR